MTSAEFAAALKSYRARHGFTQAQAAALLGVSLRTWQNWEIARNRPPDYALANLTALLALPPSSLSQSSTVMPPRQTTQAFPSKKKSPAARSTETAKVKPQTSKTDPESHLATHLL